MKSAEREANMVAALLKDMALPILCIAGPHDEGILVSCLSAGADDYLICPIRRVDLMTRIAVLLRQSYPSQMSGEEFAFGPYSFETGINRVALAGKTLDLTKKSSTWLCSCSAILAGLFQEPLF